MIYFTSDLHFGHGNIISHADRPFASVDEMDRALIDNWNAKVTARDEVYVLGDITMRGVEYAMDKLSQLRGRIYLVKGNHDWFAEKNSFDASRFEWVKDYHLLKWQNERFALFHYPILEWDQYFRGAFMLHGHQHNHADYNEANRANGIRRYDVGVDANGYAPVSIKEIVDYFGGIGATPGRNGDGF